MSEDWYVSWSQVRDAGREEDEREAPAGGNRIDRGIYFAKYCGGGMAVGEKNEKWGCGEKMKKKGKG